MTRSMNHHTDDTITDEQIRELRARTTGEADDIHAALHRGDRAARARCAGILNQRNARTSEPSP